MTRQQLRPLVVTAVVLVLIIPLVIGGGLLQRRSVAAAFQQAEALRAARTTTFSALRFQLDEETGIRGFVATHDRLFLEPYTQARSVMDATLAELRVQTAALGSDGGQLADDAARTNASWLRTVAAPLLVPHPTDPAAIERRGKALVDRFRADMALLDDALRSRQIQVDVAAQSAIDGIVLFMLGSAFVIVLIAIASAIQQQRLAARIEQQRVRAEVEERERSSLQAAYTAEKRIADTLQDAFVQRPLPAHPALRFSATYVPASEEAKVGGDWYDAVELPQERVLFSLGDVEGHGIDAAVTMNHARQSLISSALVGADPGAVLARVNTELMRTEARMVTAVVGYADASTFEFVYATAGHPPPVLLEPGRAPRMLACGGLPLGVMAGAAYDVKRVQSVPGAVLVLYTDGAVEHSRDVVEGEEVLMNAIASASQTRDADLASSIHATIFSDRAVGDDVAILTVGFGTDELAGLTLSGEYAKASFVGRVAAAAAPADGSATDARRAGGRRNDGAVEKVAA